MTWMGPGSPAALAMELRRCGWKVRQVAGRRIWYKGQAGAELVAKNMDHAFNLEATLRRCKTAGFMWGLDIAELLGSAPPSPPPPHKPGKLHPIAEKRKAKAIRALDALDSATFTSEVERDLFMDATKLARQVLKGLTK